MSKSNDFRSIFPKDKISILLDASSIVRMKNFENMIKLYSNLFALFTTDLNTKEMTLIANSTDIRSDELFESVLKLTRLSSPANGNIKIIKTNGIFFKRPAQKFEKEVQKCNPGNNLSPIDITLMYLASLASDRVILVTNDTQLRINSEYHGVCSMGPLWLKILTENFDLEKIANTKDVSALFPKIKEKADMYLN